jgi:hypothetical protein
MAEPPDQRPAAAGHGDLRASHADRERVIGTLKAAFVHGMLTKDELDLRVGQTLASRTYADLAALTADIPTRLGAPPSGPARESATTKKKAVVALACATPAIPGLLFALPPIPEGSPVALLVIALICVWGMTVPTGWFLLLLAWLNKRAVRPSAPGMPPSAGGQAPQHPRSAAPGGQLPPAHHGHRHTAEAAPIRRPGAVLPAWWKPNRRRPLGCWYAIGFRGC